MLEPGAVGSDAVHAHDVGLVLDGPRPEQGHPVLAAFRRPVRGHEEQIGVVRQLPELVRETEVVADEHRHPETRHLDGDEIGASAHVVLLTGVGEGMHLPVAVHGAVGPGQHERVRGSRVIGVVVGAHLRAGATHPDAVEGGLLGEERRRWSVLGFGLESGHMETEAGREGLGEEREPRSGLRGFGDARGESGEVGLPVTPDDVVLDTGNSDRGGPLAHASTSLSRPSRSTASSITSGRLQQAKRTRFRPRAGST